MLAGGNAWYSVVAGLLPHQALRLTRAAMAGRHKEAIELNATFQPLWQLFRARGSLRVMYAAADLLGLPAGEPPLPLRRVGPEHERSLMQALDAAQAIDPTPIS